MGLYLTLAMGKKVGGKFMRVFRKNGLIKKSYPKNSIIDPEIPDIRLGKCDWYFSLFKEFREKVEFLAKEKLYFGFYDHSNPYSDSDPRGFIKPDKISYTCEKLKEIFTKYEKKFPFHYAWQRDRPNDDQRHWDWLLFIDGEIVTIFFNPKDNYCYLYNNETGVSKKLHEGDKIKGCKFNYKGNLRPDEIGKNDKIVKSKRGDELILFQEEVYTIIKENIYERYREELDDLIQLCTYAKKKGYFIRGYLS